MLRFRFAPHEESAHEKAGRRLSAPGLAGSGLPSVVPTATTSQASASHGTGRVDARRSRGANLQQGDSLRSEPARPRVADRQQASTRGTRLLSTPRGRGAKPPHLRIAAEFPGRSADPPHEALPGDTVEPLASRQVGRTTASRRTRHFWLLRLVRAMRSLARS